MSDTLTVPFDEDVLVATGMTSQEFVDSARFMVAAKLWLDGRITAGHAAKLCGMEKFAFLYELPRHGYPMSNIGPEEIGTELEFIRE